MTDLPEEINVVFSGDDIDFAATGRGATYRRADLAPMVKPLEWEDGELYCEARAFGLVYSVNFIQGSWWYLGNAYAEGLEAAKAAAQADYERRILSALTLAPIHPAQGAQAILDCECFQDPVVNNALKEIAEKADD